MCGDCGSTKCKTIDFHLWRCLGQQTCGMTDNYLQGKGTREKMEEMFEILNEDGTLSGRLKPRSQVHKDGDLHGAAHIWVYRMVDGR